MCRDNNTSTQDCSGHGTCGCGVCTCDKGFSGTFCGCDNTNCRRDSSNQMCSGNGNCVCSKCECNDGWEGPECDCDRSQDSCMNKITNTLCSGHGECKCGQCKYVYYYFHFNNISVH